MMKKSLFFTLFAVVAASVLLVACGDKKQGPTFKDNRASEYLRPASIDFSSQDTATVRQLVSQYLSYFDKKEFAQAAELLYTVHNDSIFPLTAEQKQQYVKAMTNYNFYGTKEKSFILRSDKNNQVDVLAQIVSDGDLNTEQGVITFSLNPVLIEGQWYLTVLDKKAEGVENVYEER